MYRLKWAYANPHDRESSSRDQEAMLGNQEFLVLEKECLMNENQSGSVVNVGSKSFLHLMFFLELSSSLRLSSSITAQGIPALPLVFRHTHTVAPRWCCDTCHSISLPCYAKWKRLSASLAQSRHLEHPWERFSSLVLPPSTHFNFLGRERWESFSFIVIINMYFCHPVAPTQLLLLWVKSI